MRSVVKKWYFYDAALVFAERRTWPSVSDIVYYIR